MVPGEPGGAFMQDYKYAHALIPAQFSTLVNVNVSRYVFSVFEYSGETVRVLWRIFSQISKVRYVSTTDASI